MVHTQKLLDNLRLIAKTYHNLSLVGVPLKSSIFGRIFPFPRTIQLSKVAHYGTQVIKPKGRTPQRNS